MDVTDRLHTAAECEQKLWQRGKMNPPYPGIQNPDTRSETEEADCKHSTGHVSGRPVVMAVAGAVSHDGERCWKSGRYEAQREEEGKTERERGGGGEEEGKGEVKECSRG